MKRSHFLIFALFLLPLGLFAQSPEGDWVTEVPGQEEGTTVKVHLHMEGGEYAVDFGVDGVIEINGQYSIEGDQMTIWDVSGERACLDKKGIYTYTVNGADLNLIRVSDECEGRGGPEGMMFSRM